jgi:hypothetical protein
MAIRHPFVTRSGPPTPPSLLSFAMATSSTNTNQSPICPSALDLLYIATLRELRLVAADTTRGHSFVTPNF